MCESASEKRRHPIRAVNGILKDQMTKLGTFCPSRDVLEAKRATADHWVINQYWNRVNLMSKNIQSTILFLSEDSNSGQDDHIEGITDRKHNDYYLDDRNDDRGKDNINDPDDNGQTHKQCITEKSNIKINETIDNIKEESEQDVIIETEIPNEFESNEIVVARVKNEEVFDGTRHVIGSNMINMQGLSCKMCLKSFNCVEDLKSHLIQHVIKTTMATAPSSNHGILKINCGVCCIESFATLKEYKAHLRQHAELRIYKCSFCDKSFTSASSCSKHKKVHIWYYKCYLCNKKFISEVMAAKHILLHSRSEPVECKQCNCVFFFESMLKRHVKSAHNVAQRFPCRFCESVLSSSKAKWDHEWVIHNIRTMIADCLICGSKFRKYTDLKTHFLEQHEMKIATLKKLLSKECVVSELVYKKPTNSTY